MKLATRTAGFALLTAVATMGLTATTVAASEMPARSAPQSGVAAAYVDCTPHATVSNGSTKTASGSAECSFATQSPVSVTVTLYLGGVNEGNTYRACAFVDAFTPCYGESVSITSPSAACARTVITYTTPTGTSEQRGISVGTDCPI